jgi:hypothetical protein
MLSMIDKRRRIDMSKLTFDRWDFLGTRVVLGVIALGATGVGVIAPVVQWLRGEPLTWRLQTGRTDELVTDQLVARPGVELAWPGTADVSIDDAGTGTWLASIVPGALLTIATVIVVVALLRLLSSIEAQRPFAYAAVRSLRVIGATLLGGAVLVTLAGSFANVAVLDAAVDLQGDTQTFSFDFGNAFLVAAAGLVCAALAEAFAHGIKLADDVEGLV